MNFDFGVAILGISFLFGLASFILLVVFIIKYFREKREERDMRDLG